MTHPTLTLTEFLLARIAEDEVLARFDRDVIAPLGDLQEDPRTKRAYSEVGYLAAHLLAECEAKRRIMKLHGAKVTTDMRSGSSWAECSRCFDPSRAHGGDVGWPAVGYDSEVWPCVTLRALALPYADHPDYDEKWRP